MRERKLPKFLQAVLLVKPGFRKLRLALLLLASGLAVGITAGVWLTRDIPEVDSLQFSTPHQMTRVYSRDGKVLQEYGAEKRVLVGFSDISPNFFKALLAVEDTDFYKHHGFSVRGILRAVLKDVTHRRASQGGSTLTQQLARKYFLTDEKTITRKVRELILAINIESRYSKQQILEMYANKVCFGGAYYGVEASARHFFNKRSRDLTVPEAALLAGLIQRPSYYSPRSHPERATARRNLVLARMRDTGAITPSQYETFSKEPLNLSETVIETQGLADYVAEQVRQHLEDKYGEDAILQRGFQVFTTIDPRLQKLAEESVREGLHAYSRRRGYKGPSRGASAPQEYTGDDLDPGRRRWATVLSVDRTEIVASLGGTQVRLSPEDWKWTGVQFPERVFQAGDRVLLKIVEGPPALRCEVEQKPLAQGALVALNPHTGEVLAMVGGYEFSSSMYDRAIQARRQTGSAVKPIVYATALTGGRTLADTLVDEPTLFLTGREEASRICEDGYIPRDFDKDYFGHITYRTAIEHSVNIAAVKALNATSYRGVIENARLLGVSTDLQPYPSMALGAFEITLLELAGAYTAFGNSGVYVRPRFITRVTDRDGKVLEEFRSESRQVWDPRVAFLMVQAMTGVIQRGTAASISDMKGHFAGKTGTTNNYTDSWFMGFNPSLLCGVWTGKDDHKPLGNLETGSRVALPIWRMFMETATAGQENMDWPVPEGVTEVLIDPATGRRAGVDTPCQDMRPEYFIEGTEPPPCTARDHFRLKLPYFLQGYTVNGDLSLSIPEADVEAWVARYPGTVARDGRKKLLVSWGGSTFPVKLEIAPAREGPVPQAVMPGLPHEGDVACGARTEYVRERQ
ncbi:MAG: PBP1A family penicillin-binding protein [Acidobacteriota bacterium]